MGDGVQSLGIGRSDQLLLNKFFDPSTPSTRNIEPPAKSKMAARGQQNGRQGLQRGPILGFWDAMINFRYISFLIRALLL